jgi:PhzF family phenazine biosynthesis protein
LRWFTPQQEVDLCGHATLAAAHVLWQELGVGADVLRFNTRSGLLTATQEDASILLDFPADPPQAVDIPEHLEEALQSEPELALRGRDDLLVVLAEADRLRGLEPDFDRLAELEARGVIVTALSDQPEYDFVSRFFAPKLGIPEDPVTGTAHCTLAPYWGKRLAKTQMVGYQCSSRGGKVGMHWVDERVHLSGQAVTILRGQLGV